MITKIASLAAVALLGVAASGSALAGSSATTTNGAELYQAAYVYGQKDKAQRANHWRGDESNNPTTWSNTTQGPRN